MNRRLVIGAVIAGLALLFLWLTGPKLTRHHTAAARTAPPPTQHTDLNASPPAVLLASPSSPASAPSPIRSCSFRRSS